MANTSPATPKSILKKPTYPSNDPQTPKEVRDRELALYHATLIQQRKDVELQIILSIEALIDFPLSPPPFSASSPSPSDAQAFKEHIRTFQPSDYDSLIEERNIDKRCGYTLCPNPRPVDTGGGIYRLLNKTGKAKDFKIVQKAELEKWCSEACAKRALYVKVQLDECPAWERQIAGGDVQLLDEPKGEEGEIMEGVQKLQLGGRDAEEEVKNVKDLALERGDRGDAVKVDVEIQEKQVQRPAEPPSLAATDLSGQLEDLHLAVEGYRSAFDHRKGVPKPEEDKEDQDMDWGIASQIN